MIKDLQSTYEQMFPDKDLHIELEMELGFDAYQKLIAQCVQEKKWIVIKRGFGIDDGGEIRLVKSESEEREIFKPNENRNKKSNPEGFEVIKVEPAKTK